MANKIEIDVNVDDKGTTKKVGLEAKHTSDSLDKASKKAGEFDRNMKGASRASSNATKNFSKMAQGGGGIAAVYAQIAAQVFAISAAFQFLKSAADTTKLIKGQEALGAVSGVAYKTLTQTIQAATGAQLGYNEAAQAAAIGTAAGLSASQLENIGKAARNVSNALGRDLTDSFNRLVRGITKAEPELLDELGIVLRLKPATEEYARAIGKTAETLSDYEKSQAIANNVLTQAEQKFGKIAMIMDPAGESLNRFLASFDRILNTIKQDVISILEPVFNFLSRNTESLVAVIAAISTLIVKSLIPDFGKFAQYASGVAFNAKRSMVAYRKEIQRTKDELALLSASEAANVAKAQKNTKFLEGMGSKGGNKAIDWLTGESDTKRAQASADKMFKDFEARALKNDGFKRSLLANYTETERKAMHDLYLARSKMARAGAQVEGTFLDKSKLNFRRFTAWVKLQAGATAANIVGMFAGAARAISGILAFGGWVGAIIAVGTLLFSLGKEIYDFFFPVSKEAKLAEDAVINFTDSIATLNDELSGMSKVRTTINLTLSELTTQSGQAAASADILNKALQFKEITSNKDKGLLDFKKYKEAEAAFDSVFNSTKVLVPGMRALYDQFKKTGNIDELLSGLSQVQQEAVEGGAAVDELRRSLKSLAELESNMLGNVKTSPFIAYLAELGKASSASATQVQAAEKQAIEARKRSYDKIAAAQAKLDEKTNDVTYERGPTGIFRPIPAGVPVLKEGSRERQAQLDILETEKQYTTEINNELQRQRDLATYLAAKRTEMAKISEKYFETEKKISHNAYLTAKAKVFEYTEQDKLTNLQADALSLTQDYLAAQNSQRIAQAEYNTAMDLTSKATQDQKDAADAALKVAKEKTAIEKRKAEIAKEQNDLQQRIANIEIYYGKTALEQQDQKYRLQGDILKQAQNYLNAVKEIQQVEETSLKNAQDRKLLDEKQKTQMGGYIPDSERRQKEAEIDTQTQIAQNRLTVVEAETNLKLAQLALERQMFDLALQKSKMEIATYNETHKIQDLDPVTKLTSEQTQMFNDLSTASGAAFDKQVESILKQSQTTSESLNLQIDLLRQSKIELTDASKILKTFGDSFESGLATAFEGIITGTMKVKDAFKQMAIGILKSIAQVIAQAMAARIALSFFGVAPAPVPTAPAIAPPIVARVGGVFSNGNKVPGYATGGVAQGPRQGFPAVLHGTEAVVPLPNGRSIPVDMRGTNQQQNNVTVNVNMADSGTTTNTQSDGKQGANLGNIIAAAVQQELQNQKRSGGILNPYGVA